MTQCGFAAILGAPNAGKSTLLNRMTGAKLSIVSPKAQTTRFRVLGILMRGAAQILLVDTPGIFKPRRKLDRAMVNAAWTGAEDSDLVMLLVDAKSGATEAVREIAGNVAKRGGKAWLVLNKVDIAVKEKLLVHTQRLYEELEFEERKAALELTKAKIETTKAQIETTKAQAESAKTAVVSQKIAIYSDLCSAHPLPCPQRRTSTAWRWCW
jgi:GTP-binding protein Era